MVKIRIPGPLRRLVGGKGEFEVEANLLKDAINELIKINPEFKDRLFDENGELRRFVNIYVNDEDTRFLQGLDTSLKDGDEVSIIPAIAGGENKELKKKSNKKTVAKYYLTYPPELVKEPIIWELGQKFKVITNIKTASVKGEIGLVALEMEGNEKEITASLEWLKSKGIGIEPIEQDVIEG